MYASKYLQEPRNNLNYESNLTALRIFEKRAQISSKIRKIFSIILFALEKKSNQRSAYSKTTILTAKKLSSVFWKVI